jgi:hypothetical protein
MSEGFVQLPSDGSGKKLRTRDKGAAGHEQYVALAGAETWDALADAVVPAANKHHISVFNAAGSGRVVRIKKLFAVNLQTAAATGVVLRFNAMRITAASAGTTITPVAHDTANAALPAGVTVRTNGTVTESSVYFPWVTTSEEETPVAALSKSLFQQSINIIPEGPEVQEYVLREGFGFSVKQITSSAVGSFAWFIVFTVD